MIPKKELKLRKEVIIGSFIVILLLVVLGFVYLGSPKIKIGDTVSVNYAGYLENGSVFDTNIEKVALENGIAREKFEPLTFKTGAQEVVPGFEKAIIGMGIGDSKRFTISPEEGYKYNDALVFRAIPRESKIERFFDVPVSAFVKVFEKSPKLGDVLSNEKLPFPVKVVNYTMELVSIEALLKVGDSLVLSGTQWKSDVIASSKDAFTIMQNPEVGMLYLMPTPTGFLNGNIIGVDDKSFDVDTNHPLAGKSLTFEVTVVSIGEAEA